jgi:hypothetical protein
MQILSRGNLHTGFLGLFFNGLVRKEDRLRTVNSFLLVDSECTVHACYICRNIFFFFTFCLYFQKFI